MRSQNTDEPAENFVTDLYCLAELFWKLERQNDWRQNKQRQNYRWYQR